MKKDKTKRNIKKLIVNVAKKVAVVEANTTCPYFGYQEKESKQVKKLRKF